ncbi:MAG: hypothetical protein OJF60_003282 [Burkholderiaceae bacterium]|nr:MAG: hypothetical protein OJF60_003282 [Burkholderiaceae bacterium]
MKHASWFDAQRASTLRSAAALLVTACVNGVRRIGRPMA